MEKLLSKYAKYLAYGILVTCVILMAYILYEISQAKQRFAGQLIQKSITQTESELDSFFDRVHFSIAAMEQQYQSGYWDDLDNKKTILHNISLIESYPPISSIGIADQRGYEFNVIPDSTEGYWLSRRVFVDRWGYTAKWRKWELDDTLKLVSAWEDSLSIDTRERPWYRGAIKADGDIFWTKPYVYTTGPIVGITASTLVNGSRRGDTRSKIIAFDLTLDDLNEFVGKLDLTKNQNIFLLSGDKSKVIAFRKYSKAMDLVDIETSLLLSPSEFANQGLLNVINKENNNVPFSFNFKGKSWWGIEKVYPVTQSRNIRIVSILPESDFALEINRTLWVTLGSFFLIILLSVMMVVNHNKLHRLGNILSNKNNLISEQKRFLFSEVHHRVKNNLALISAFLELDQMRTHVPSTGKLIKQILKRIKVISLVQETAYQSESLGMVQLDSLVADLIRYCKSKSDIRDIDVDLMTESLATNINLALSYGLLINEILTEIAASPLDTPGSGCKISLSKEDDRLITSITISKGFSENLLEEILAQEIIRALLLQLKAESDQLESDARTVRIKFENKETTGIMGHRYY